MDLDTISSGDSVSGDNALRTSPVLMVDQELAVILVHSNDSDPDPSDELCQFRSLNGPLLPVPSDVSWSCVWWSRHRTIRHWLSPSCYLPYLLCRYLPTGSGRTVLL